MSEETVIAEADRRGGQQRDMKTRALMPDPEGAKPGAARVTISRKIGWSSGFGREKADVVVAVEVPCGTSTEAIHRAMDRASALVDERLPQELDDMINKYFEGGPITFGNGGGG